MTSFPDSTFSRAIALAALAGGLIGSVQAATVSYEAEAGVVSGGANIQSASGASGGRIVGHIVDVGSALQVVVDGGAGGAATLSLRVSNGYGSTSRLSLYVNGARQGQLTFAPTGSWYTFTTLSVPVTLAAGSNTLRIQHDTADTLSADIDRIDVVTASPAPAPAPVPAPTTVTASYEAEAGAISGGANIQTASNASGGRIVGHLTDVGAYLQWNVDGGAGGTASLVIRSSNGTSTTNRLGLYVNGTRRTQIVFAPTGSWNSFVDLPAVSLALAAGANTIRLQHDAVDAGSADIDILRVTRSTTAVADTQAPTAPSGLVLSGLTCTGATLSWSAATDNVGVAGYDIYHDGQKMVATTGSALSTPLALTAGANWGLYVNARDAAGNVSQASATLPVAVPQCQLDTQAPTVPTGLRGSVSGTTASLAWTASTDNVAVTAYDVYRDAAKVGSTAALTYADSGLSANSSYTYSVAARDAQNNASVRSVGLALTTGSACTSAVCSTVNVTTDADIPWGLLALPDGNLIYSRRDARTVILLNPATGAKTTLGTVPNVQGTDGEGGLLGLAATAGFPTSDPWLYVYHTSPTDNRVVRLQYRNGSLDTTTLQVLLSGIGRNKYHNGGRLRFGPDGKLYVATGDAQNGADAQDLAKLSGKILRMNADGSVPSDNPFGTYVWSYGHRNPQGLAFDSQGRLWQQEFGNSVMDETNLIQKGGNYGWPNCEGTVSQAGGGCATAGYIAPVATYLNYNASCSGIAIVRDVMYVACLRGERVYRHVISGGTLTNTQELFAGSYGRLRTVEPSADGGLWLTTSNDMDSIAGNSSERVIKVNLGN